MTTPQHLTSDGKEALRKTIRGLRAALIEQLTEAAEREYRLGVPLEKARLPEEGAFEVTYARTPVYSRFANCESEPA